MPHNVPEAPAGTEQPHTAARTEQPRTAPPIPGEAVLYVAQEVKSTDLGHSPELLGNPLFSSVTERSLQCLASWGDGHTLNSNESPSTDALLRHGEDNHRKTFLFLRTAGGSEAAIPVHPLPLPPSSIP